jgi:hypothetical protein
VAIESHAEGAESLREHAVARLKKQRDFKIHAVMFVAVNALLIGIWAATNPDGFFWPIFPLLGWGIGLAANAWDAYGRKPITEEQIQREMERLGGD